MVNIFRKISNTLSFRKLKKNYDYNFFVEDQNNKFKLLGFNRKQALENAIAGGWKDLFPLKQSYKPEEPEFKPRYFKASDNDLPPTLAEMGKTAKELMEGQL